MGSSDSPTERFVPALSAYYIDHSASYRDVERSSDKDKWLFHCSRSVRFIKEEVT